MVAAVLPCVQPDLLLHALLKPLRQGFEPGVQHPAQPAQHLHEGGERERGEIRGAVVGVESGCFSSPFQLAVGRYPVHLAEGEGPGEELAVAGEAPEMAEGHVIGFTAGKTLDMVKSEKDRIK